MSPDDIKRIAEAVGQQNNSTALLVGVALAVYIFKLAFDVIRSQRNGHSNGRKPSAAVSPPAPRPMFDEVTPQSIDRISLALGQIATSCERIGQGQERIAQMLRDSQTANHYEHKEIVDAVERVESATEKCKK